VVEGEFQDSREVGSNLNTSGRSLTLLCKSAQLDLYIGVMGQTID
jgi:hypothetical protein